MNVVVTGASAGIGAEIARAFVKQGHRCMLAARRVEKLNELASELKSTASESVNTAQLDVTDNESVDAFCRQALAAFDGESEFQGLVLQRVAQRNMLRRWSSHACDGGRWT